MKRVKLWAVMTLILLLVVSRDPVRQEKARQVAALEQAVAGLDEGQLKHQRNLAKWYNYQLEQGTPGLREAYYRILNFGEGRMALLEVPELNLRLPIFHGPEGTVGHDPDTPLPIGGRGNHTILILSEEYPWKEGQFLRLDCLGRKLTYRVESIQVMPKGWPAERSGSAEQEYLTMVCDGGHTRTLVRCVRCSDLMLWETKKAALPKPVILTGAALLLMIIPAIRRKATFSAGVHMH